MGETNEGPAESTLVGAALGLYRLLPVSASYAGRRDDFRDCLRWAAELQEVAHLPADDAARLSVAERVTADLKELIDQRKSDRG